MTSVFFTVLQVFTMFYKCQQLFSTVLQVFTTLLHCFTRFCLSFFYLAKINGFQCDNAPQEE